MASHDRGGWGRALFTVVSVAWGHSNLHLPNVAIAGGTEYGFDRLFFFGGSASPRRSGDDRSR